MKRLVRALAVLHRWLGAPLCIPFAVWFLSGIVMVFAGFPGISLGERLAAAPALDPARVPTEVELAARRLPFEPERVSLVTLAGEPTWRFERDGELVVIGAEGGALIAPLDEASALRVASEFLGRPLAVVTRHERLDESDQWTPHAGPNGQLPLLRVDAEDAAGTEVYVSMTRARVVQRTTARSRLAAWLGAIPHWWYPIALRRHAAEWRMVVLIGSGLGTAVCVLGLVLGLVRLRSQRSSELTLRWSPYQDGWLRWHHLAGLCFGVLALSWVWSGMLSLNPGRLSSGSGPSPEHKVSFRGAPVALGSLRLGARQAIERCREELAVKSLELIQVAGHPYWLCVSDWNQSRLVDAAVPHAGLQGSVRLDVLTRAARAAISAEPLRVALVSEPDDYVYPTHLDPEVRFPLVRFDFSNGDWLYVDPHAGSVLRHYDATSRAARWLYEGLHRLDVAPLYRRRWLWTIVVVGLCAVGAAFSSTGIVLAARWIRRATRRSDREATPSVRASRR